MALGLGLLVAAPWRLTRPRGRWWRRGAVAFWWLVLAGFGIRIRVRGKPAPAPGTLYVANHISWTDIPVLGYLVDAGFVAKSEVRGWPVVGPLAAHYACTFVARERRHDARAQAAAVASRVASGMVLFPEGTTGEGGAVLPFRSSLFAMAEGARVQPVCLRYLRRDGTAFTPAQRRRNAWMGDDTLLPHAVALALSGGVLVEVWFGDVLEAAPRKLLAETARAAIGARLGGSA